MEQNEIMINQFQACEVNRKQGDRKMWMYKEEAIPLIWTVYAESLWIWQRRVCVKMPTD